MYCEVNTVPVQIDYISTRGSQGKPTDSYVVCSGSYFILETDSTRSDVKTVLTYVLDITSFCLEVLLQSVFTGVCTFSQTLLQIIA